MSSNYEGLIESLNLCVPVGIVLGLLIVAVMVFTFYMLEGTGFAGIFLTFELFTFLLVILYFIACKPLAPKLTELHNMVSLIVQEDIDTDEKMKKINTYLANKVMERYIQGYNRTDLLYEVEFHGYTYRFTLVEDSESTDEVTTGVHRGGWF